MKFRVSRIVIATGVLAATACSSHYSSRRPSSSPCEETRPNQECFHGGSAEAEKAEFDGFAVKIREIIERQASDHNHGVNKRGFHAKNQTCLRGAFWIYPTNYDPYMPPFRLEDIGKPHPRTNDY